MEVLIFLFFCLLGYACRVPPLFATLSIFLVVKSAVTSPEFCTITRRPPHL